MGLKFFGPCDNGPHRFSRGIKKRANGKSLCFPCWLKERPQYLQETRGKGFYSLSAIAKLPTLGENLEV